MRFLRHESQGAPYVLRAPYPEGRAALLAKAAPRDAAADQVWGVIVDLGMPGYVLSVFVFSDETIAVYGSAGIHSAGLRGAPAVRAVGLDLLAETAAASGQFRPIADAATQPLPAPGNACVIARTASGDSAATSHLSSPHGAIGDIVGDALLIARLAHEAIVAGFEPAEAGDFLYEQTEEFRNIRRTLLDWSPKSVSTTPDRVGAAAVEFGEAGRVTSVFAFDDGSIGVYSSDGAVAEDLGDRGDAGALAERLRRSIQTALDTLEPVVRYSLPQPGFVQFVARTHDTAEAGTRQLHLVVRADKVAETHPLAAALEWARELRAIGER